MPNVDESRSILFIVPAGLVEGQPSRERIQAFRQFFQDRGFNVDELDQPQGFAQITRVAGLLRQQPGRMIFLSMPPFRNWWIPWFFGRRVILDIRDGWSIAMATGYGGTVRPNRLKAFLARRIERRALRKAALPITCTPGLQDYLSRVAGRDLLLITNGFSARDRKIIADLSRETASATRSCDSLVAICVGQFAEYGRDKAEALIRRLVSLFPDRHIDVRLLGCNRSANGWIADWCREQGLSQVEIEILPRVSRESMYREILAADVGLAVIRDPDYDFGTKVFDYILCGKPIVPLDDPNLSFCRFFAGFFVGDEPGDRDRNFERGRLIEAESESLLAVTRNG